jgi:hypothetical protein
VTRVWPSSREIALHEAYHAAALCLAGLVPKCVRTDWPEGAPGATDIDWGEGGYRNPASAKSVLVAIVLGATTEGHEGWDWETWPIDPTKVAEGAQADALMVRELGEHFGLDRVDWSHILWKAEQLGCRQDFRGLVVRITDELERVDVLTADDLKALMEAERQAVAA